VTEQWTVTKGSAWQSTAQVHEDKMPSSTEREADESVACRRHKDLTRNKENARGAACCRC
jgi:hypothetical protein